MGKRMTREEFLEAVFSRRYEELKGRELRTVRVRVVGKELSLAQLIGVTDRQVCFFRNKRKEPQCLQNLN